MKTKKLFNTNLTVSNICLGTGNFGTATPDELAFEILDTFAKNGGNFIDTANVYGKWIPGAGNASEITLGKWLKARNAQKTMLIATKGAHPPLEDMSISRVTKSGIAEDLAESKQALGLDTIDFFWLHRDDESQPIEAIIDMMEDFVQAGDIRYYGASNFKLDRMEAAWKYCNKNNLQGFSGLQNQWALAAPDPTAPKYGDPTMILSDDAFYEWHVKTKMPAIPYSATAAGFFHKIHSLNPQIDDNGNVTAEEKARLNKKVHQDYLIPRNFKNYQKLAQLSNEMGVDIHQLTLAYFFGVPFDAVPITSVRNMEQLQGLMDASDIVLPYFLTTLHL